MKLSSFLRRFVATLTSLCLAIFLFTSGLLLCCAQPTTRFLAHITIDESLSPYSHDQLVTMAVATRDYTVEGADGIATVDSKITTQRDKLYATICKSAREQGKDTLCRINPMLNNFEEISAASLVEGGIFLGKTDESLGLPPDALSHLDDVHAVCAGTLPFIIGCGIVAAVCSIILFLFSPRTLRHVFIGVPLGICILFLLLGLWALLDFMSLFGALHALLFPQGNWEFAYDSLLICMLPTNFWIGMGLVWITTTILLSAFIIVVGFLLKKKCR